MMSERGGVTHATAITLLAVSGISIPAATSARADDVPANNSTASALRHRRAPVNRSLSATGTIVADQRVSGDPGSPNAVAAAWIR